MELKDESTEQVKCFSFRVGEYPTDKICYSGSITKGNDSSKPDEWVGSIAIYIKDIELGVSSLDLGEKILRAAFETVERF